MLPGSFDFPNASLVGVTLLNNGQQFFIQRYALAVCHLMSDFRRWAVL
ncbi:hypothetical protein ACD630_08900 [Symbiopectobacterium sp. RP]